MTERKLKAVRPRLEALVAQDRDLLKALVKEALDQILQAEMTDFLGAAPGQRSPSRLGYRAGYYERGLITRVGKIELRVPRDRNGEFSTSLFERFQRSEKALLSALVEMYVQGVSTRKVRAITEELCGHSFSASTISAVNKTLDEGLHKFAHRRLTEAYPYRFSMLVTRRCARTASFRVRRCSSPLASTGKGNARCSESSSPTGRANRPGVTS